MTRIDHLVYGAPDLEAAVQSLEDRLGVRASPGGRHPQWGTHNALITLGQTSYLEILAPDPDRPPGDEPKIFGLNDLTAPRLVAWAAKANDLASVVEGAARAGVELGPVRSAGRDRPDGTRLSWQLTDPEVASGDGLVPFLIDWGDSEHPAGGRPPECSLVSFHAEHPDPAGIAAQLAAIDVLLPVLAGRRPALVATLDTPRGTVEIQ